jgi:predicted nucleic acid-binding protein
MKVVLDTGPLVALLNARDRHHRWAREVFVRLPTPLWTCEAVLTEASYLTGEGPRILGLVSRGALRIGLRVADQADEVAALMERYGPRMDLADACIVRMTELTRRSSVLTLDRRDFTVYRRHGRDVIPLVAPS